MSGKSMISLFPLTPLFPDATYCDGEGFLVKQRLCLFPCLLTCCYETHLNVYTVDGPFVDTGKKQPLALRDVENLSLAMGTVIHTSPLPQRHWNLLPEWSWLDLAEVTEAKEEENLKEEQETGKKKMLPQEAAVVCTERQLNVKRKFHPPVGLHLHLNQLAMNLFSFPYGLYPNSFLEVVSISKSTDQNKINCWKYFPNISCVIKFITPCYPYLLMPPYYIA